MHSFLSAITTVVDQFYLTIVSLPIYKMFTYIIYINGIFVK